MNIGATLMGLAGLGIAAFAAMTTEIEEVPRRVTLAVLGLALMVTGILLV